MRREAIAIVVHCESGRLRCGRGTVAFAIRYAAKIGRAFTPVRLGAGCDTGRARDSSCKRKIDVWSAVVSSRRRRAPLTALRRTREWKAPLHESFRGLVEKGGPAAATTNILHTLLIESRTGTGGRVTRRHLCFGDVVHGRRRDFLL